MLIADSAVAQTPRFRLVDIREIGFTPEITDISPGPRHGTISINNWGQIVYARDVGIGDGTNLRAWAYLPQGAFGRPEGVFDISGTEGAAWDINMAGLVVGQIFGSFVLEGQAVVWPLSTLEPCPLGYVAGPAVPDRWSVAYAINDQSPPIIVGDSLSSSSATCTKVNVGFRVAYGGTCPVGPLDVLAGFDTGSYARDVGPNAVAVGFSYHSALPDICQNGDSCQASKQPLVWPPLPDALITMVKLFGGGGHEARGTNNAGNIVGWGYNDNMPTCLIHAVFWPAAIAQPFDLHASVVPPVSPFQQTRADAINNRTPMQAVGGNLSLNRALLWEQNGGGAWTSPLDLDAAVKDTDSQWQVIAAHDINDKGCIAAFARRTVGASVTEHVVLLYDNCPADCSGDDDAEVGIADLLALLAQWGSVGSCDMGLGDPGVGINELLVLLANWGPCCTTGTSQGPPQSVEDCIYRSAPTTLSCWSTASARWIRRSVPNDSLRSCNDRGCVRRCRWADRGRRLRRLP